MNFDAFNNDIADNLCRYKFESILNHCLLDLTKLWNENIYDLFQKKEKVPWNIARLILWSAKYSASYSFGKPATIQEYEFLYSKLSDAPIPDKFLNQTEVDMWPFLRCLLFNQAPYQIGFGTYYCLVERAIFLDHMKNYDFGKIEKGFGLDLRDLIDLKYMVLLFMTYSTKKQFISEENFSNLSSRYPRQVVYAFLNQICLPYPKVKEFCVEFFDRLGDPSITYFSRFPFFEKPLIKIDGRYTAIDRASTIECLNFFLYHRLKKQDSQRFSAEFGIGFQNYIELSIKNMALDYIAEEEISRYVSGKPCDFVVISDDCVFFIECKSMEWHHGVFTNPDKENIIKAFKTSVTKGYVQIENSYAQLKDRFVDKQFIGIILTYKFLPYGNSIEIWKDIQSECPQCAYLHENIFVMSCYEFESLFFRNKIESFNIRDFFTTKIQKNRGPKGDQCSPMEFLPESSNKPELVIPHLINQQSA